MVAYAEPVEASQRTEIFEKISCESLTLSEVEVFFKDLVVAYTEPVEVSLKK